MAQNDKPDKLQRMRELVAEFDSHADVIRLIRDLHHEEVRNKHMETVAAFGTVTISDWTAMRAYMNEPPSGVPLHELLARASAEIEAALTNKNDSQLFGLLFLVAKAVKPHNLYARKQA